MAAAILAELGYGEAEIDGWKLTGVNPLYETMATSVFERMSAGSPPSIGAVNLGQGFPDFGWPEEILDAAARALTEGSNQYAPSRGLPALREAVAAHYGAPSRARRSAPTTSASPAGATEALAAAILAVVEPGDEVIVMTPAYDAYAPLIRRAGGVVREVALQPPGWRIERAALEAAVTLENPRDRLQQSAQSRPAACSTPTSWKPSPAWRATMTSSSSATRCGSICCSTARRSSPLASLAGMAERTLKCGSAGKIFSLTGWKIGWIAAAPELATLAARAHQFLTFAIGAQPAGGGAPSASNEGDAWIAPMRQRFARARDRMTDGLRDGRLCGAAERRDLFPDASTSPRRESRSTTRPSPALAVEQAGVAVVPLSPFAEQRPAAPPRPPVLRQARRDDRRRRRGDGQGEGAGAMSPADEAPTILRRAWASTARRRAGKPLADRRRRSSAASPRPTPPMSRPPAPRAQDAFLAWRTVPAPRRGELVRLLGEELRAAKEPLARLVTLEAGKIVSEGLGEVQEMIDICDYAVGLSRQLYGLTIASERPDHRMIEQWHPLGPVAVITAFNFPVAVWAWNAALALVCGDPVIWKPSEKTPLTAAAVMALAGRALARFGDAPDGLLQLVQGGREVGEALVDDPRIALVSATGSTAHGPRASARASPRGSAARLLELGGNNAMIVAPSADLDARRARDPVQRRRDRRPALHHAAPADRP